MLENISDTPTKKRILTLHPKIRDFAIAAIIDAEASLSGANHMRITYGLRTFAEQDALYAKGRTAPGGIVTRAKGGQSYHNYGLALDFCLIHPGGKASFSMHEDLDSDGISDWVEVAEAFKKHGFEWGGDWPTFKDNPHVQMTFGHDWRELLALHNAGKVDDQGYVLI